MSNYKRKKPKEKKHPQDNYNYRDPLKKLEEPCAPVNPKPKKKKFLFAVWTNEKSWAYRKKEKRKDHILSKHETEKAAIQAKEYQEKQRQNDIKHIYPNYLEPTQTQRKFDKYWVEEL